MCGLVGIAGSMSNKHELFMKRLLLLDYFRGTDSTGLAAIRTNGITALAKAAVNPITLFDMKAFDKSLNGFTSTAFIGHNRAATLGAVNDANAHPYQFGDITGAHNGTLDKASWERLEQESGVSCNTDSAAIFACINEIGIDDTIKLMETGRYYTTGAWALVWYDKTKNTLNFLKNEHRPLWYGFSKNLKEMYWASEWEMLEAASSMTKESDWDGWHSDAEGFTFFPFYDDHLYSINLGSLTKGLSLLDVANLRGRKIEGRKPAPLVTPNPTPARGTSGGPWQKTEATTTSSPDKKEDKADKKDDFLDDDISDFVAKRNFQVTTQERSNVLPFNGFITEERFNELAKYGCSYCSADVDINDSGITIYESEGVLLCSDCSKHGDTDNVKIYLPPAN